MRIALVTPAFPPSTGGVEDHVARIAEQLIATGIDVEVFTGSRGLKTSEVEFVDGLVIRRFPAWRTTSMSVSPRLLTRTLHLDKTFDVVHVHSYHASSALTTLIGRTRAVVFTPHFHGSGHTRPTRVLHTIYRQFSRALFTSSSTVICVSDAERDLLYTYFPDLKTPATVIPNGVDAYAVRRARPYPDEGATVMFHGRLEPYKRVDRIIEAMTDLPKSVQLVIVGDGSDRSALADYCTRLGLGTRVRFLGMLDTPEVYRWLKTSDVCVSLSEHEAFGIAPLESAAARSRIILSDIPAHRELVGRFIGDGAVLLPPTAGCASIARAITRQLGAESTRPRLLPDWVSTTAATVAVYRDAIEHGRNRVRSGKGL